MILTLDEIKENLRIDGNAEDALLERLCASATASAEDYCRRSFSCPDTIVPEPVRSAVMIRVSYDYTNRESDNEIGFKCMMMAFHSLLGPYRDEELML